MDLIKKRIRLIRYLSFGGMFFMITGFVMLVASLVVLFTAVVNDAADDIFLTCIILAGVLFGLWVIATFTANLLILITKWAIPEFEQEKIMWAIFGFFIMGWIGSLLFTSKITQYIAQNNRVESTEPTATHNSEIKSAI